MELLTYTPARDPLGHTAVLDQRAAFPLLGVPLELRSNSAAVIALAEQAFGGWRAVPPELVEPVEPCVVNIVVHPVDRPVPPADAAPAFVQRVYDGCFLASDGINVLSAQYDQGRATGFIAPELLAQPARLRYSVLELLSLLLVTQHDRVPVHTGAVVRNGLAILLAGRSTAGKSTLCYACLRAGFQLLAEDVVYVGRRRGLRLWGVPSQIHLLPDAVRFFPELAGVPAEIQSNGKLKLAVETERFGGGQPLRHAERAAVCVVERHSGADAALEPIDPAEAVAVLSGNREPGFDLYAGTRDVAAALAAGGAYRLRVGHDLDRAVSLLGELAGG
jgi:hypothetical protein